MSVGWLAELSERAFRERTVLVGLMSGTSADAADAAVVELRGGEGEPVSLRVLAFEETPHSPELRSRLLRAFEGGADIRELCLLNVETGRVFGAAARRAAEACGLALSEILAVGSHGQTVWHEPPHATLQIGCPAAIAAECGLPVVSDFRAADVALGGQGAPLAPYLDWALFRSESVSRALLNVGGIANIAFLPAGADLGAVAAFDTGPGNALMDAAVRHFSEGRLSFDRGGEQAAQGVPHTELLREWMRHPYYAAAPPKSTGRELFGEPYARGVLSEARQAGLSVPDALATLCALTAETVADAAARFGPPKIDELIVSGGGSMNRTLMRMLEESLGRRGLRPRFRRPEEWGLSAQAKEAVLLALLARESLRGVPANVPSATGASGPAVLGSMTAPPTSRRG